MSSVVPRSDGHPLVRVRQSCVLCHGPDGAQLGTASLQLPPRTELLAPANTVEEDRVLRAKRESKSFRALLRFFRES
jgi:mono/diheme cytochrome c family protein